MPSRLDRTIDKVGFTYTVATVSSGSSADYYTDGVADEIQIQAAVDVASTVGGGTVLVKRGTYIISSAIRLPSYVSLQGEGFATILKYADGSSFNGVIKNSLAAAGFGTKEYRITVRDLYIDGNQANATGNDPRDMIFLSDVVDAIVSNVYVYDCVDSAIVLDNDCQNCIVSNNIIDTTTDIGIYISDTVRTNIIGNQVRNTGSYGIRVIKYNSGYAKHCVVANNIVQNCGQTLNVDGIIVQDGADENIVSGNSVISSGRHGIYMDTSAYFSVNGNFVGLSDRDGIQVDSAARGTISGNIVHKSSQEASNTYAGILLNGATDCIVSGNRSGDAGSGTRQKYGIEEKGSSDNNTIVGNMLDRNSSDGCAIVGASTLTKDNRGFNPNILYVQGNVTGSTTFNRANGSTITATLTGNITVTLTAGKNKGDELTLILTQDATGSRIVTWPSNFKKAGGELVLSTAGSSVDVIKMLWDGSNWREVARALNIS